jgi:phthalate 4,5-cis-dihydrodiol dehydrogenase
VTLGIGVVGLGIAGSAMMGAIHSHPGVRLVAAVDPQVELAERFTAHERLPAFAHVDELLRHDEVDVVYVASPHQFHREQAIAAMRAGRHVIVEKPMALGVEDCEAMIATAHETGRVLVVGHSHGFDPVVRLMRDLVADQVYGPLGMIATWNYTDFLYRPRRPEELDPARGGGVFLNQLPHQVDVIRTIAPSRVVSVSARAVLLDPARRVPGAFTALVDFEDGVVASLLYSGYDHFDAAELYGWVAEGGGDKVPAHGSARARLRGLSPGGEQLARTQIFGYRRAAQTRPRYQPRFGELVVSCAGADLRIGPEGVVAYTDDGIRHHHPAENAWWPGRGDVFEELIQQAEHGRPALHDGQFGRDSLMVCLAVQRAATENATVDLVAAGRSM